MKDAFEHGAQEVNKVSYGALIQEGNVEEPNNRTGGDDGKAKTCP